MEQSVVQDLLIELTPLPPLCPDGKAIVERLIREIKRRMMASDMKGVYAERPLDPVTKKSERKARTAAVHSLAEAYRLLLDIVTDHNHRPHSALRRKRILAHAGIEPTPQAAYLWGLEHVSGVRTSPLSERDFRRFLLSTDEASLSHGILKYKGRPYLPDDEASAALAAKTPHRAKRIEVRVDKMFPYQVEVPVKSGEWAVFKMTEGAAGELYGTSIAEEDAFHACSNAITARSDYVNRINRVTKKSRHVRSGAVPRRRDDETNLNKQTLIAIETERIKRAIMRGESPDPGTTPSSVSEQDWTDLVRQERERQLTIIRKTRKNR